MGRVCDYNRAGASAVGGINELSPFFGIADNSFDGCGLWTDDRNHSISRHYVPKTDIDKLDVHKSRGERYLQLYYLNLPPNLLEYVCRLPPLAKIPYVVLH